MVLYSGLSDLNIFLYTRNEVREVYWNHPVCPSVDAQFARLGKMVSSA